MLERLKSVRWKYRARQGVGLILIAIAIALSTIPAWNPDLGIYGPRVGLAAFGLFITGVIFVRLSEQERQRR